MARRSPSHSQGEAYEKALVFLARREHSARELKSKLELRGLDGEQSRAALAELQAKNYQSDERFGEMLVRSRLEGGYGARWIIAELRQHGIACQIVPGVTAAVACAAYAGIPLTHREHARTVHLLTGHGKESMDAMDWPALAQDHQTMAVYMGVARLDELTQRLLEHGRRPDTPFAIIENGTLPQQRVVSGVLRDLPALAKEHAVHPPALLIIGEVAALAHEHAWFGTLA